MSCDQDHDGDGDGDDHRDDGGGDHDENREHDRVRSMNCKWPKGKNTSILAFSRSYGIFTMSDTIKKHKIWGVKNWF